MTYFVLEAVLAIAARRLSAHQARTDGAELVAWTRYLVRDAPRVLNKKPRTAKLSGVFYLEAWRGPSPRALASALAVTYVGHRLVEPTSSNP